MDFERATLKALFYDYPIESAVKAIRNSRDVAERDIFMDILPQLVRWSETAFTTTEARLLQDGATHNWLSVKSDDMNSKEGEKGEDLIFLTFYNSMRIQPVTAITPSNFFQRNLCSTNKNSSLTMKFME